MMPVMRYRFEIIKWTQNELNTIDQKTRKILYKYKFHHPQSNTHRLYLSRNKGGRGLIGIEDCQQQECTKIAEYMVANKQNDPLINIVKTAERKKKYGIMTYLQGEEKAGTAEEIDKEHMNELKKMKMHGEYWRQRDETVNIDMNKSEQWLEQLHLRFETKSLICAAQEQALATKYTKSKIWGNGENTKGRLCIRNNTKQ